MSAEGKYTSEVEASRARIKELSDRLVQRCLQRMQNKYGRMGFLQRRDQMPQMPPIMTDAQHLAEQTLSKLVATMLLDQYTKPPVSIEVLHKKIQKGPYGGKYERALNVLSLSSPEALVLKMGNHRLLEAVPLEINGRLHTFITNLDRMQLSRVTGVEDPLARSMPATFDQQAAGLGMMPPVGPPPAMPPVQQGMPGMQSMIPPPRPPAGEPPFGVGPGPGPMGPGGFPGSGMMPGMPNVSSSGAMMPPNMQGPGMQGPGMQGMGMMPSIMGPTPPGGPPSGAPGGMRPPSPPDAKRPRLDGGDSGSGGDGLDLGSLLNAKSVRDKYKTERGEELLDLLAKPSARESAMLDTFRTSGGSAIREHCPNLTKEQCRRAHSSATACSRVHFRKLVYPWTDESLGNCSYLDTCRNMRTCKYVHYELDSEPDAGAGGAMVAHGQGGARRSKPPVPKYLQALGESQWLKVDVRTFDMTVLGKFGVIMADPPWEIHQDLPYGTMADDEMRNMNIGCLQDDGVIFLWVTGRAMELGRECLKIWGYKRVDELIWVKTNQLQRLIRTGRTGHWLNHSKEHCLVGYKGNPQINRHVDCDVVVAEVRETSRKPDEMYSLLERLSPGTRKLEIFARGHNLQLGWVGIGNQLDGCYIKDPDMMARYKAKYGNPPEPKVGYPEHLRQRQAQVEAQQQAALMAEMGGMM